MSALFQFFLFLYRFLCFFLFIFFIGISAAFSSVFAFFLRFFSAFFRGPAFLTFFLICSVVFPMFLLLIFIFLIPRILPILPFTFRRLVLFRFLFLTPFQFFCDLSGDLPPDPVIVPVKQFSPPLDIFLRDGAG